MEASVVASWNKAGRDGAGRDGDVRGGGRRAAAGAARGGRARGRNKPPRASLYEEVTQGIIAELEAGRFPWVQPWDAKRAGLDLPRNAVTGRPYSGINILILWSALAAADHPGHGWLTFRQAHAAGGAVRKGARGVTVFYADRFTPEAERERAERAGETPGAIPFLKRFTLFNIAQCEGLPEGLGGEVCPRDPSRLVPAANRLIGATGADLRIGGPRAYYAPEADHVVVPPASAFLEEIDWYRTALHELGHWTGHARRLGRDLSGAFGSPSYAREELVAELSAAFTCAALGIQPSVRHANYLASWLAVLRCDNRAIFRAASLASKASDFLLACSDEPAA